MRFQEVLVCLEEATHHAPKKTVNGYVSRCPAHDDSKPSLSISEGNDGRILLKCHAGCSHEAVRSALRLSASDLAPNGNGKPHLNRGRPSKFVVEAEYDYRDASGTLLYQVCRLTPKDFRQRRPDSATAGGWIWNLKGIRDVPYRLPQLITAVKAGQTIFIAEGEKDVEALVGRGFPATCNSGGAGNWRDELCTYFDGAKSVVIIPDKDRAGRAHAATVAAKLKKVCPSVKMIELPDIERRLVKDAADFFAAGGTSDTLAALASATPEYVPASDLTPGTWFKQRFPKLAQKYGEPVHEILNGSRAQVRDLSEDFMGAVLGPDGMPKSPTVFLAAEQRFYTYDPATGVFHKRREEEIQARLSELFHECVQACREHADVSKLAFGFRDTAAIAGIVRRAKGLLAVEDDFFTRDHSEYLPVANGMLRLKDRALLPSSPSYRCRHKLSVEDREDVGCPRFMETLLKSALSPADVSLIQRWAGQVLIGINRAQKMMLLTGTAGGGKSTLVSVIMGIVGSGNVGQLRTEFLGDRFEIGRLIEKTLLYGADVPENFLSKSTASSLKSLTGGDLMTAEFKNSNESPQIKCQFNVIVTSNSRLTVFLEGDSDAWRRRLIIVKYCRPKPTIVIPGLAERILAEEGPGVLNFMLEGLEILNSANWQITLNDEQQKRVDDLLLESDSHRVFARECLLKDSSAPGITKSEVFTAYTEFCEKRGWIPMHKNRFGAHGAAAIMEVFTLSARGDIKGPDGKQNDGWKYLRLKTENERNS